MLVPKNSNKSRKGILILTLVLLVSIIGGLCLLLTHPTLGVPSVNKELLNKYPVTTIEGVDIQGDPLDQTGYMEWLDVDTLLFIGRTKNGPKALMSYAMKSHQTNQVIRPPFLDGMGYSYVLISNSINVCLLAEEHRTKRETSFYLIKKATTDENIQLTAISKENVINYCGVGRNFIRLRDIDLSKVLMDSIGWGDCSFWDIRKLVSQDGVVYLGYPYEYNPSFKDLSFKDKDSSGRPLIPYPSEVTRLFGNKQADPVGFSIIEAAYTNDIRYYSFSDSYLFDDNVRAQYEIVQEKPFHLFNDHVSFVPRAKLPKERLFYLWSPRNPLTKIVVKDPKWIHEHNHFALTKAGLVVEGSYLTTDNFSDPLIEKKYDIGIGLVNKEGFVDLISTASPGTYAVSPNGCYYAFGSMLRTSLFPSNGLSAPSPKIGRLNFIDFCKTT